MIEYYKLLEKNKEFFERVDEIAKDIARRAKEIFGSCDVYVVGSYARKEHKLSSDLDILIVSDRIPRKYSFDWYSIIVKKLTDDYRINIHLLNEKRFKEVEGVYSPRIKIQTE